MIGGKSFLNVLFKKTIVVTKPRKVIVKKSGLSV